MNMMMLCLGYTLVVNMVPCVNVGVVSLLILQMEEYENNNRERIGHVEILSIALFLYFSSRRYLREVVVLLLLLLLIQYSIQQSLNSSHQRC